MAKPAHFIIDVDIVDPEDMKAYQAVVARARAKPSLPRRGGEA